MQFANIIFPAPSAVYITSIFVPLATILALGTEFFIFARAQRGVTSNGKLCGIVLTLNVFSWVVGWYVSELFPSGLVPRLTEDGVSIMLPGPQWTTMAVLSFPGACLVSIVLEYAGLQFAFRRFAFHRPLVTIVIANVASYIVLGAAVYLFIRGL